MASSWYEPDFCVPRPPHEDTANSMHSCCDCSFCGYRSFEKALARHVLLKARHMS